MYFYARKGDYKDFSKLDKAEELLPTKSGFFFGDTGYGDDYFEDVKDADDLMRKLLDDFDFDEYQLVYSASW